MKFSIIKKSELGVYQAQKKLFKSVQGNEQFDHVVIDFLLRMLIFGRIKSLQMQVIFMGLSAAYR